MAVGFPMAVAESLSPSTVQCRRVVRWPPCRMIRWESCGAKGLPAWGLAAVIARSNGGFTVIYWRLDVPIHRAKGGSGSLWLGEHRLPAGA